MKVSKKIMLVILTVFVIMLLITITHLGIIFHFSHVTKWKYNIENFEDCKSDFESIAEFCLEYDDQITETKLFSYNNRENKLFYDSKVVDLTEAQKQSLENIENAFPNKDAKFDYIRCSDGVVYFITDNSYYSVVYSPNKRPKYIDGTNEGISKKIQDDWYHIIRK